MKQDVHNGLAMPEAIGSYIKMFQPEHREIEIDKLNPLHENELIYGAFDFESADHERMTSSLKAFGQYQYVTVYQDSEGHFIVINGWRVVQGGKGAGFTKISCAILNVDKHRAFEISQVLNSGNRKITYAMKAKKLELIEKHAKQYLRENGTGDNEASELTVRQYMATLLQMSETYVSDFKAVCAHPDRDLFLDQLDCQRTSLKKAAAEARNQTSRIPSFKKNISLGSKPEPACEDCPRRRKFQEAVDTYGDQASEIAACITKESEADHD